MRYGIVLLAGCFVGTASAAPMPKSKPRSCRELVRKIHAGEMNGEWVMLWGGSEYRTWLDPDGSYRCEIGSAQWVGTWRWLPNGNLLFIEAKPEELGKNPVPWWQREVILERSEKGKLNRRHLRGQVKGGPNFELRRK
jgi:hypothetical protein